MSFEVLLFFFSSGGHLFSGAGQFEQFGRGPPKKTILSSLAETCPVVYTEKMSFEVFLFLALVSILCSRAE